jgi:hypothetical protein
MDVKSVTSIANTLQNITSHFVNKKQIGWDSHAPLYIADRSSKICAEKKYTGKGNGLITLDCLFKKNMKRKRKSHVYTNKSNRCFCFTYRNTGISIQFMYIPHRMKKKNTHTRGSYWIWYGVERIGFFTSIARKTRYNANKFLSFSPYKLLVHMLVFLYVLIFEKEPEQTIKRDLTWISAHTYTRKNRLTIYNEIYFTD